MKFYLSASIENHSFLATTIEHMKRLLSISFALILGLTSYAQTTYKTHTNLSYYEVKDQTAYMKERCKLDLYVPESINGFPTVVWFHGGGLTGGSKELPEALQNKGMAVIGVNYRLSPKVKVKDCIADAAAAVAWAFKHIAEYGGDPNLIFVSGHSAGGYLASMVGMDKSWLAKYEIDANDIAGLIPFSGHTITHFTARQEMGMPGHQPLIDELAPLYFVRADAPPLLLITGDRELEMLGRYEENAYMMRMMRVAGHQDTRLMEMDGYGHGMTYPAFPLLVNEVSRIKKLIYPESK